MRKVIELPVEEVVRKYESGVSMTRLSDMYGVSFNTIRRRLVKYGCIIRSVRDVNIPLDENSIVGEYNRGASINELSKKYGVAFNTIRRRIVKAGVEIRSSNIGKCISLDVESIVEDYKRGDSMYRIACKHKVSEMSIRRRLVRAGVEIRSSNKIVEV